MILEIKKNYKEKSLIYLIFAMLLISVIKVLSVQTLPIYALTYAVHDDRLMVNMANSMLSGEWLGEYSHMTLVKGIMHPLFLAICNKIGLPYLTGITVNYLLACLVATYVLSKVIKSKIGLFCIYFVLLFNPITVSSQAFQRVYRCSLTPAHIIFLLACLFGMYLWRKENKGKMALWAVCAGVSLGVMWNTREDGIWVVPLVVFFIGAIILNICVDWKMVKRDIIARVGIALLPIVVFCVINNAIALTNYIHYGIYTTNELNDSQFTNFMKSIYSVKPYEEVDFVATPRETMDRICAESPTLNEIKSTIDAVLDSWEVHGKVSGDFEVENGWFFWALRDAVAASGYYADAKSANEFYKVVSKEIEQALDEGRLERRATMPSVLMAPWKEEYFATLLTEIPKTVRTVVRYDNVYTESVESVGNSTEIRLFEVLTNNLAIYPSEENIHIAGWMFAKNEDEWISVNLVDNEKNVLSPVVFEESNDVYEHFLVNLGLDYSNAKYSRFRVRVSGINADRLPLQIEVKTNKGNQYYDLIGFEDQNIVICIDIAEHITSNDIFTEATSKKVDLINKFNQIYSKCLKCIFVIGVMGYLYITILYFKSVIKKQKCLEELWLFLSGILGSLFVLIVGVTYTHISAYDAVNHLYLSAAYPLSAMFGIVSVVTVSMILMQKYMSRTKVQVVSEKARTENEIQ